MTLHKSLRNLLIRLVHRQILLSGLVGLVAGIGAVGFYFATNSVDFWMLGELGGFHLPVEHGARAPEILPIETLRLDHRWYLFLIPALGGLISGWLVFTFAPEAEGHGTDAAIDAFHNKGGMIRGRVPWIKAAASAVTIGTGGSAGKEGPIAQIGAGFGSFIANRLGLTTAERRVLLLAGISGGIGATFHAPLGGALFAVEVLYRDPDFEHEALIPCIISSIVAYSVFGAIAGWQSLLATPLFIFRHPPELLLYLALGLTCALFGIGYTRLFYGMRDLFRRIPIAPVWRPAIGGLLVGLLGMVVPQVFGAGYGWVQAALYGKMALGLMVVVALAKILATSLTIPSGGSGGVFAPSLVIGALLGGAFGQVAGLVFPALVSDPRAYVLVGMAGFFAGVSSTPMATLIMVSELTGNYGLLAPLMLVCVVAMIAVRRQGIYEKQVNGRIDSPAHMGDFVVDVLEGITVGDLAEKGRQPTLIPEHLSLQGILQRIATAEGAYYPVVNEEGRMTGIFSVNDLRRILDEDIPHGLVCARDIAVSQVVTSGPGESLNEALRKLAGGGLEEIPVVAEEDPGQVLFMLSRRSLLARYASELEKKRGKYVEI